MTSRPKIRFLVPKADGRNGVARSVLNTAEYLASDYEVEILGLFRRRDQPAYPTPPGVRLSFVQDVRRSPQRATQNFLAGKQSRLLFPSKAGRPARASLLTDLQLLKRIRQMTSGVLITTRPELHVFASRFAPKGLTVIAQDHMNYPQRPTDTKERVKRYAKGIDALVVLTDRDREDYTTRDDWPADRVWCIPNSMPWRVGDYPTERSKVVIAAGRLARQKGFDRLIAAYAPLARIHPDWQVHVYGEGRERRQLQKQIDGRGLTDSVQLKGWTDDLGTALATASVFALPSRYEGLPLVGVEAMGKGLPLVSFDCPRGPRELVRDGQNGFLVGDGDIPAFSQALDRAMSDESLRERMGRAAHDDAWRYDISSVGKQWEELFVLLLPDQ